MKRILPLFTIVTVCISPATLAQKSMQEILLEIDANSRTVQIELDQSRLRQQQMEAETARWNLELERLRLETDRLRLWNESKDASKQAKEIAERAEQAVQEQAEAIKKAEEATEELQNEIEQDAVKTRNYIYLVVFALPIAGFIWYVIRNSRNEEPMNENQKWGISTIICSALAIFFIIMVSDDWVYQFDFLHNLMTSLRIRLFAENDCTGAYCSYVIDFPTKYAVFIGLGSAAYGFTTYLGITSLPEKLRKYFTNNNMA